MSRNLWIAIIVAALGYFVDVYDIVLFTIVRRPSLEALGLSPAEVLDQGITLLNLQMTGMLVGGLFWGILGDRVGRLSVLFGSIFLYSIANIANAFVPDLLTYGICRFVAGVGLAGEIGAGITLVSELMPREHRGLATTLIATIGVLGAIGAAVTADLFSWKVAYIVGGVMGLFLLALRVSVRESEIFSRMTDKPISRGDPRLIVFSPTRLRRYLGCIFIGAPFWVMFGLIVSFGPEYLISIGTPGEVRMSQSVIWWTIGLALGDVASGVLSQVMKSRLIPLRIFLLLNCATFVCAITSTGMSTNAFYLLCTVFGFANGSWAVLLVTSAEQFGTNLRATVTTSVPNFIRGTAVIITLLFSYLKPHTGMVPAIGFIGAGFLMAAGVSLMVIRESFHHDLDFHES